MQLFLGGARICAVKPIRRVPDTPAGRSHSAINIKMHPRAKMGDALISQLKKGALVLGLWLCSEPTKQSQLLKLAGNEGGNLGATVQSCLPAC